LWLSIQSKFVSTTITCLTPPVQANGEEPPEQAEPQVDIEAEVEAAMAAVKQSTASEVTDADVLSALLEQEVVSKHAIIEGLALHMLAQEQEGSGI
jgi:hypothetical protein